MAEKTEDCPICPITINSPIPVTHPPQEKAQILQYEPTKGVDFGRSRYKEDGETEGLGYSIEGEEDDGVTELFGGIVFSSDVAK